MGFKLSLSLSLSLSLDLMYGGCVLKAGKTLDQYHIAEGCTLHVVQRRKKGIYIQVMAQRVLCEANGVGT